MNGSRFGAFLSAYNGAFNLLNLAQNYIGDTGSSTGDGSAVRMKLDLTAGQAITLMVNQVNDDRPIRPTCARMRSPTTFRSCRRRRRPG